MFVKILRGVWGELVLCFVVCGANKTITISGCVLKPCKYCHDNVYFNAPTQQVWLEIVYVYVFFLALRAPPLYDHILHRHGSK